MSSPCSVGTALLKSTLQTFYSENCKGKKKLVLDCRYANAYERAAYKPLSDVTECMQLDGRFVLTDAKSGCHHVCMHPDSHQYLALEFKGQ